MPAQSFLAKEGIRYGILGTAVSLSVAFPLANGDYSPAAHTDASRMGFYADRTPGAEAVVTNVLGSDLLSVGVLGITSPMQVRAAGIASYQDAFIYWDGSSFAIGGATLTDPFAPCPFVKSVGTFAGGGDTGHAFYQTSATDGTLLTGAIGVAAPAAFTDPGSEYTEMYFLVNGSGGALKETLRLNADYRQIMGHASGLSDKPTFSWVDDFGTGLGLVSGSTLGFWTAGVSRMQLGSNYISSTVALQVTGGVAAAVPSGVGLDQSTPTTSRLIGWGPDNTTVSTVQIFGTSANASIFSPFFEINASEILISGDAHVTVKLTVGGLINQPTGLALTPVAANPGGGLAASTLWVNSGDANKLYFGAAAIS